MILLIGPSAVGKTEVANELFHLFHIKKVVTHTTRLPRKNEVNDIDYHFVTKETFLEMKKQNVFVETTYYNDNYYGTSRKELGNNKVIIVDPNGKNAFLSLKDPSIIIFYLKADDETRKKRMMERGDSEENIQKRLKKDLKWFNKESEYGADYILDSSKYSIEELAKKIFELYHTHFQNIK